MTVKNVIKEFRKLGFCRFNVFTFPESDRVIISMNWRRSHIRLDFHTDTKHTTKRDIIRTHNHWLKFKPLSKEYVCQKLCMI